MSTEKKPWVSFCMSTYKRPLLLHKQLSLLLQQTYNNFEIIISDNDPEASGMQVAKSFTDERIKYYSNGVNLGMVQSFNKSIQRATSDFIVMVTDDDPINPDFLSFFYPILHEHPNYSIYCGVIRKDVKKEAIEIIEKEKFISEILDIKKTPDYIWSSCIMKKEAVLQIGGMPDYGSPTLADGAMIALTGSVNGGLIVNKMFSHLVSHSDNFTRFNINLFEIACKGFYETLKPYFKEASQQHINNKELIIKQLGHWFLLNYYVLKKHFTIKHKNENSLKILHQTATRILNLPYMHQFKIKYVWLNIKFSLLKWPYILRNRIVKYKT